MATKPTLANLRTPMPQGKSARAGDGRRRPDAGPSDFTDTESRRVLSAAARALAAELGRQAAREYFANLLREVRS